MGSHDRRLLGDRWLVATVGDVRHELLEGGNVSQGHGSLAVLLHHDVDKRHPVRQLEAGVGETGGAEFVELCEDALDQLPVLFGPFGLGLVADDDIRNGGLPRSVAFYDAPDAGNSSRSRSIVWLIRRWRVSGFFASLIQDVYSR